MTARTIYLPLLLLALTCGSALADAQLGRLFFTPAERKALEDARRRNVRAELEAEEAASRPKAPRPRSVTVQGVVRRSDGESTVWINGKPVEGSTADGLKVRVTAGQGGAVIVHEPRKGQTLRLKVGQHADIVTGRVQEGYESRAGAAVPVETPPSPQTKTDTQPPLQQEARPQPDPRGQQDQDMAQQDQDMAQKEPSDEHGEEPGPEGNGHDGGTSPDR